MDILVLAVLLVGWVWLLRPSGEPRLRPTKASSEEIWAALERCEIADAERAVAATATRRRDDRKLLQMPVGEHGYVAAQAVGYDHAGCLWLRTDVRVQAAWSSQTPVRVTHEIDGFHVTGPVPEEIGAHVGRWLRRGAAIPAVRSR